MLNVEKLIEAVNPNIEKNIGQFKTEIEELNDFINKNSLKEDEKTVTELIVKAKIKDRLGGELASLLAERDELKTRAQKFWNAEHQATWASQKLSKLNPLITSLEAVSGEGIDGVSALLEKCKASAREYQSHVNHFDGVCLIETEMAGTL